MLRRAAAIILFAVCSSSAGHAAVFKLATEETPSTDPPVNNLTFTLPSASGITAGTYTASGEFKVDTGVGSSFNITAWNILVTGPSSFSQRYVANTEGFTTNSFADPVAVGNTDNFTVCLGTGPSCDNSLNMNFVGTFNSVYQDAFGVNSAVRTANTALLESATLKISGTSSTSTAVTGQADFVPFAPAPLVFFPILSALAILKKKSFSFPVASKA